MKVTARKLQKAKTTFKVLFFAFATIFSLSIFTCTPGLGNQVDTKAPSVVITSPATKSTLNGSFTVTGTASDDLAVTSVELYFTNISTSVQYGPYPATVGSNGTWSLSITPRSGSSSILPDGDYNIKAMAYDKSQHSGQTDVVYTIDTTPPTVMLTSPTTYSITPEFSKTITIKGEVYDASSLSSVWVYITDKNGVIKATTLAEGTNTFIASFSREQLTALVDYDGTKNTLYYYYAVATDIGGNKNTYDFHRGDIASILQGATSFPSINSIGYVDQGKSSDLGNGINTDSLDGIKKNIINARNAVALVGTDGVSYPHLKYSQTEQNKIQWINVTGRSEIDNGTLTEIEDTIPVGFAVTGTVLPTSDESTQQNFQVYLRKLTATEIAALNTVNPATGKITTSYLDTLNIETDEYSIPSTTDSSAAANTQGYFKMVGSSFSLEIKSKNPADPSSTDWTSGCYWIKIVYETDSGSQLQDEALFNISSEAPILHESGFAGEENQASGYYRGFMTAATKTAGTNKLSGYAANSSETDAVGSLVIVRPDGSTQDAPDSYITDLTSADKFKYSYIIDYDTDGSDDGEKTYTIVADNQTRIQRAVVIDTTSPEISFSNISEDENNLTILDSTSYTIRGTALDDNGI
nr:hypothetical protein [Treponemataceae bacterium]